MLNYSLPLTLNNKPNDLYLNMNALSRQYFALSDLCANIKNRYKNIIYLCFPEYETIFKGEMIYSESALTFIEKYPNANIISNTRFVVLQIFFKKNNFRYWENKVNIIKKYALKSYPSVNMNDESVSNLSQLARLINNYQKGIESIKYKLIFLAKKSKYFESINSIFGIDEFTAGLHVSIFNLLFLILNIILPSSSVLYILDSFKLFNTSSFGWPYLLFFPTDIE